MSELRLLVRNTDRYMYIDPKDWNVVRYIKWFYKDGLIISQNGRTYEDVIGLSDKKNMFDNIYDKRRNHYVNQNEDWIFSEYYGRYIESSFSPKEE